MDWFILSTFLLGVDCIQTIETSESLMYYEQNKILGKYPTKEEVLMYFGGVMVANYLIGNSLGEHRETFWEAVSIVELKVVHGNYSIGVGVNFNFN